LISFITENIIETISELRDKSGKDIWLVGGGELISMLLAADLIDEMRIAYIPVILGKGIPLFPEQCAMSNWNNWNLTESKTLKNGVLGVTYQKKQ
jgi:dihydrofolate reductase